MTVSAGRSSGRPVIFGEVLFDHFPDGSAVLGGAPFNVAWNLQAFGQAPRFISRVGHDHCGQQLRDAMRDWGMDTGQLQFDSDHPTGSVSVRFEAGEPQYGIVDACAYDFITEPDVDSLGEVAMVYHGTLAMRNDTTRRSFESLMAQLRAPRFLDVNLRAPWWQATTVLNLLDGATWVKLNEHELTVLDGGNTDTQDAAQRLLRRYKHRALIVTRGHRGADLLTGNDILRIAPAKTEQVVDTVGAGDAFASVILLGLLHGWPDELGLQRAQAFASAVVGMRGATCTDAGFYAHFTQLWEVA